MKPKSIISLLLLLFVAISVGYMVFNRPVGKPSGDTAKSSEQGAEVQEEGDVLVVYFFHGSARCKTCKIIESFGTRALEEGFPEELKSGRIVWRDINLDEPENEHFVQEYQVLSITLVISVLENGEQKQWKNLEEVWKLLKDEQGFKTYVQEEVRARL